MCFTSCEGTLDDVFGEWSRPTPGGGGSSAINATAIKLSQTMKVIKLGGDALTITATVTPSDATYTWESSDPTIATGENGVVTPKALGIAKITAKSGDVKATCEVFVGNEVNISSLTYDAKNYDILKGDMGANQLTIPAGYHVALDGLTINNNNITCSGDATIYLTDGSTNMVTAPINYATAIKIGGEGTTLTINAETLGTGILNATGGKDGAGIGTEYALSSSVTGGNIVINGGVINATGQGSFRGAAGIGTGGAYTGYKNECGAITIGTGITSVAAIKGDGTLLCIGKGPEVGTTATVNCGVIKFGTASVFDGSAWSPSPMTADTYGGLKLAISTTTVSNDTWTLTPAP